MTTSQSGIKADSEVGSQSQNIVETAQYFIKKTASLNVVKTTIQPNGQIIDWIPIESQEEIASPPPLPALHSNRSTDIKDDSESWKTNRPIFLLEQEGSEKGPGGAVPILRQDLNLISGKQTLAQRLTKPPFPPGKKEDRSAWPHWYASTGQSVNNLGTNGGISCYKAAVQNPADFSLLQTAIIKNNVPMPGNPYASCVQTVEVGWINYPAQVAEPHLFTFFNTNGYTEMSDYKEGWNTDVKGWVQYDNTIFPGTVLTPLCVDDGSQTELPIQVQLHQGNWWVLILDRWIGYYPVSLSAITWMILRRPWRRVVTRSTGVGRYTRLMWN